MPTSVAFARGHSAPGQTSSAVNVALARIANETERRKIAERLLLIYPELSTQTAARGKQTTRKLVSAPPNLHLLQKSSMTFEARYKVGNQIVGPRSLDDIRREIQSGMLPKETPLQLTADGLWTTLEGAEKKLSRFKPPPSRLRSWALSFIIANATIAAIGYFKPFTCFAAAGFLYLSGIILNYFEEGKERPAAAFASFLTLLFPFLGIHVFKGSRPKPIVLWLVLSAVLQLVVLFCILVFWPR